MDFMARSMDIMGFPRDFMRSPRDLMARTDDVQRLDVVRQVQVRVVDAVGGDRQGIGGSRGGVAPPRVASGASTQPPGKVSSMIQKSESMNPDAMVAPGSSTAATDVVGRTPMVPREPISTEEVTRRPVETQTEDAPKVAAEVADKDAYRRDFGAYAPDPEKLAASLKRSKVLSDEVTRAAAGSPTVTALRDVRAPS